MEHLWILWILLGVAAFLTLAVFLTSYICFAMTFYVPKKKKFLFRLHKTYSQFLFLRTQTHGQHVP